MEIYEYQIPDHSFCLRSNVKHIVNISGTTHFLCECAYRKMMWDYLIWHARATYFAVHVPQAIDTNDEKNDENDKEEQERLCTDLQKRKRKRIKKQKKKQLDSNGEEEEDIWLNAKGHIVVINDEDDVVEHLEQVRLENRKQQNFDKEEDTWCNREQVCDKGGSMPNCFSSPKKPFNKMRHTTRTTKKKPKKQRKNDKEEVKFLEESIRIANEERRLKQQLDEKERRLKEEMEKEQRELQKQAKDLKMMAVVYQMVMKIALSVLSSRYTVFYVKDFFYTLRRFLQGTETEDDELTPTSVRDYEEMKIHLRSKQNLEYDLNELSTKVVDFQIFATYVEFCDFDLQIKASGVLEWLELVVALCTELVHFCLRVHTYDLEKLKDLPKTDKCGHQQLVDEFFRQTKEPIKPFSIPIVPDYIEVFWPLKKDVVPPREFLEDSIDVTWGAKYGKCLLCGKEYKRRICMPCCFSMQLICSCDTEASNRGMIICRNPSQLCHGNEYELAKYCSPNVQKAFMKNLGSFNTVG